MTIPLDAHPDAVFRLMCPVREREWVPNWNPTAIWSESGVAEKECVFLTEEDGLQAVWIITDYLPRLRTLQLVRTIANRTVTLIDISVSNDDSGGALAHVSYSMTAISEAGFKDVAAFTDETFRTRMDMWRTKVSEAV